MNVKLTDDEVRWIRNYHKRGAQTKWLCHHYGVGRTAIKDICYGRSWKRLLLPEEAAEAQACQ